MESARTSFHSHLSYNMARSSQEVTPSSLIPTGPEWPASRGGIRGGNKGRSAWCSRTEGTKRKGEEARAAAGAISA